MKRFISTKKRIVAAGLAVGLTLGVAGAAFAYFTATGSGSGTGSVGSTTAWTVNNPSPTGATAIYPGVGSQSFAFTVKNSSNGSQGLQSVTATVAPDAAAAAAGCSASWYDVNVDTLGATPTTYTETYASPIDLAVGSSRSVSVVLTMPDANTNQNACEGDAPVVTLTAN